MANNTRKLINTVTNFYENFDFDVTEEQQMWFETGVAVGIKFALTELIDTDIDLQVLGDLQNEKGAE